MVAKITGLAFRSGNSVTIATSLIIVAELLKLKP
jgi:hypothetical protein